MTSECRDEHRGKQRGKQHKEEADNITVDDEKKFSPRFNSRSNVLVPFVEIMEGAMTAGK